MAQWDMILEESDLQIQKKSNFNKVVARSKSTSIETHVGDFLLRSIIHHGRDYLAGEIKLVSAKVTCSSKETSLSEVRESIVHRNHHQKQSE